MSSQQLGLKKSNHPNDYAADTNDMSTVKQSRRGTLIQSSEGNSDAEAIVRLENLFLFFFYVKALKSNWMHSKSPPHLVLTKGKAGNKMRAGKRIEEEQNSKDNLHQCIFFLCPFQNQLEKLLALLQPGEFDDGRETDAES